MLKLHLERQPFHHMTESDYMAVTDISIVGLRRRHVKSAHLSEKLKEDSFLAQMLCRGESALSAVCNKTRCT